MLSHGGRRQAPWPLARSSGERWHGMAWHPASSTSRRLFWRRPCLVLCTCTPATWSRVKCLVEEARAGVYACRMSPPDAGQTLHRQPARHVTGKPAIRLQRACGPSRPSSSPPALQPPVLPCSLGAQFAWRRRRRRSLRFAAVPRVADAPCALRAAPCSLVRSLAAY